MMKTTHSYLHWIIGTVLLLGSLPGASSQDDGKLSLGVKRVEVTSALMQDVDPDRKNTLNKITSSLENQLINSLHETRKFKIIARGDLEDVLEEQDLQRGLSGGDSMNAFEIAGCEYVVVTTVDNFQDVVERLTEGGDVIASKRNIGLSAIMKIYKTKTGELEESANLSLDKTWKKDHMSGVQREGEPSNEIIQELSHSMANTVSDEVMNVIFPAKVIAITGETLMVNRGEGTSIAKGQTWQVFQTGQEIVDPDTGEVLGKKEIPVGKVQITNVRPKFARAKILKDQGIEKLNVLRLEKEN